MKTRLLLTLFVTLALLISGCGSDSPTDPGDDPGPDQFQDTPAIPRPTSPGGSVPARSVTLTRIAPQALSDYAPKILDVQVLQASVQTRAYDSCSWQAVASPVLFDLSKWPGIAGVAVAGCDGTTINLNVPASTYKVGDYPRLFADGELQAPFYSNAVRGGLVVGYTPVIHFSASYDRVRIQPMNQPVTAPYLRRDRFWRVKPIEGQVGEFLLLTGPVSGEVTTSYTAGVSKTASQSFGASITATVGAQIGPINASLSATLSSTFDTSVTISEESTQSFSKAVFGEDGKTIQFMVWELVEVFSLTDENGDPYTIEGWALDNPTLERAGAALALDATTFVAK